MPSRILTSKPQPRRWYSKCRHHEKAALSCVRRVAGRGGARTIQANVMKSLGRLLLVALVLVLLAGCAGIFVYCFSAPAPAGGSFSLPRNINDAKSRWKLARDAEVQGGIADFADTFLYGKIDTTDATLRRESLDRSICRLTSDSQQYSGYMGSGGDAFSQDNLEEMLTSRRAVKVLQSMRALPPAKREAKCRQMFAQAFRVHTNTFRVVLENYKNPSLPKNTQSVLAMQLALCAALFAAAESGQRGLLAEEFAQLDRFRDEFELHLFSRSPPDNRPLSLFLRHVQPDHRFQVNILRLAASAATPSTNLVNEVDQACFAMGMRTKKITIAGWDAQTGGMTTRGRASVPADPSLAVTEYTFLAKGSGRFNYSLEVGRGFVEKLRSLVLDQMDPNPEEVIVTLTRKLAEEKTPNTRCAAALALGRLPTRRDPRVLSALVAALNDEDPAVARCAGIALNGEQGAGGGVVLFSGDLDSVVGLGKEADAAIPGLVRLLRQDPWKLLRDWSALVLQQLGANGSPRATAALAEVLNDPSFTNAPGVRGTLGLHAGPPVGAATSASDTK
jgi:hypothetical protein